MRIVDQPTALVVCDWHLMEFAQTGGMVHIEHYDSATFLSDDECKPYVHARQVLKERALSEQGTRDRLEAEIERVILGG
ncbi:hypothetical protein CLV40_118124 [Actinokineospora auranticolor]|uniref:DUF5753 domain-containing protein n=1 Tax=Actinokineospora auranticolor TaxID=155976 RepID=A0A2S6GHM7_9PSEU|nr:hypothetical protein CLV40_118124 [Actinokineospora auranticolor]